MKTHIAWEATITATEKCDQQHARGIVTLGGDASGKELASSFQMVASFDLVKGFAIGHSFFDHIAHGTGSRENK